MPAKRGGAGYPPCVLDGDEPLFLGRGRHGVSVVPQAFPFGSSNPFLRAERLMGPEESRLDQVQGFFLVLMISQGM